MKPATSHLGQEIQVFLLRHGAQLDTLAHQMGLTPVGLSNLIHGRRHFRDETLRRMAATPLFTDGGFSLQRLKAFRAMDEYDMGELMLAVLEYVKGGALEDLPGDFFEQVQAELIRFDAPPDALQQLRQYFGSHRQ